MSNMIKLGLACLAIAGVVSFSLPAAAENYDVKELNRGSHGAWVFEPALTKIQPGDTVTFEAADHGHDVKSVDGMIPEGAEPFKSSMSETLKVTFTKPGVYVFQCTPHVGLGMVGAIVVGKPDNIDKIDPSKLPGTAKVHLNAIVQEIRAINAASN